MRRLTVNDLVEEVRSVLDENNRVNVTDEVDILPALNRAQDYGANILARHFESPLLTYKTLDIVQGEQEYNIPEDAFERRLEKIEVNLGQVYYPIKAISYRDITSYETPATTNIPYYYAVIGHKFRLIPKPTNAYPLRVWYLKDPEPLILAQGRLTVVNAAQNYVIVDEVGDSLTTDMGELNSFVNLVDGDSGLVKARLQIQSIQGNKITFKTSPSRTKVLNHEIGSGFNVLNGSEELIVEPDDYICVLSGTCVPFFKKPLANFLIQYAVAEIQRKLGGPAELEQAVLKELEKQVERSWVGREQDIRVKKVNRNWGVASRRFFNNL